MEINMPTKKIQVHPETMLVHNGATVYRTHVDNDVDQGVHSYWFTLNPDTDDQAFDIRVVSPSVLDGHPPFLGVNANPEFATATQDQINTWRKQWYEWNKKDGGEYQAIRKGLMDAIDRGVLKSHHDESVVPSL